MTEIIRKITEGEVKKLSERTYEFIASTEGVDRDGELIEVAGWDLKNFKKNPVIMYGHDYRGLPVGRAPRVWKSAESLKNTVEFPPEGTYEFADICQRMVEAGFLKTESVGFMPIEWEEGDGDKAPKRTYKKQELLEISLVPVPSQPEALIAARDAGVITTKELETFEGEITKPEEEGDWIRIPVRECDVTATIDISEKEGIKALYCGEEKQVKTYMFDKREPYNWTMAKAKKWVEEHKSLDILRDDMNDEGVHIETYLPEIKEEPPQEKEISQAAITDELNYLIKLIESVGMNEDVEKEAWELVREVLRLSGDDIPVDILEKVGAVLNQKNKDRLNQIKSLAQQVLDSAGQEEPEDDKVIELQITEERVMAIVDKSVSRAVIDVIEKAQGKVS